MARLSILSRVMRLAGLARKEMTSMLMSNRRPPVKDRIAAALAKLETTTDWHHITQKKFAKFVEISPARLRDDDDCQPIRDAWERGTGCEWWEERSASTRRQARLRAAHKLLDQHPELRSAGVKAFSAAAKIPNSTLHRPPFAELLKKLTPPGQNPHRWDPLEKRVAAALANMRKNRSAWRNLSRKKLATFLGIGLDKLSQSDSCQTLRDEWEKTTGRPWGRKAQAAARCRQVHALLDSRPELCRGTYAAVARAAGVSPGLLYTARFKSVRDRITRPDAAERKAERLKAQAAEDMARLRTRHALAKLSIRALSRKLKRREANLRDAEEYENFRQEWERLNKRPFPRDTVPEKWLRRRDQALRQVQKDPDLSGLTYRELSLALRISESSLRGSKIYQPVCEAARVAQGKAAFRARPRSIQAREKIEMGRRWLWEDPVSHCLLPVSHQAARLGISRSTLSDVDGWKPYRQEFERLTGKSWPRQGRRWPPTGDQLEQLRAVIKTRAANLPQPAPAAVNRPAELAQQVAAPQPEAPANGKRNLKRGPKSGSKRSRDKHAKWLASIRPYGSDPPLYSTKTAAAKAFGVTRAAFLRGIKEAQEAESAHTLIPSP